MTSWRHTTRLFHFYCFSSSRWANGQAPFRLFFLKSRRWTGNQNSCARVLLTPRSLSTRQGQDVAVKRRVRTLRSQLLFWLMFYEANSHPRRAFGNQHIQSNPEHPQYSIKCFEPERIIYIIFIFFQVFYQVFFIFPTVIHSRPVKNAKKKSCLPERLLPEFPSRSLNWQRSEIWSG